MEVGSYERVQDVRLYINIYKSRDIDCFSLIRDMTFCNIEQKKHLMKISLLSLSPVSTLSYFLYITLVNCKQPVIGLCTTSHGPLAGHCVNFASD